MSCRLVVLFAALLMPHIHARVPWTTSRIQGSPEPAKPFIAEEIWQQHPLNDVLEIVGLPGQVLMVESRGKVWSVPRDLDSQEKPHLLIELKALYPNLDRAYGLAPHPQWREKKEIFLSYTIGTGIEDGTKLSRFQLSSIAPIVIDPESEETLLTWLSGGHNGAHLEFGADGILYITTGDPEVPFFNPVTHVRRHQHRGEVDVYKAAGHALFLASASKSGRALGNCF